MNIRKITTGGLLVAVGILLPQVFHISGIPQSGNVFLPMHIPVLLSGFLIGPLWGLFIGIITPIISSLLTGMPPVPRLYFMILELSAYGCIAGVLSKRFHVYISLIFSMIGGRIVYGLSLLIAGSLLGIHVGKPVAALTATITGIPGIIIQLIFIPAILFALKKGGYAHDLDRASQS